MTKIDPMIATLKNDLGNQQLDVRRLPVVFKKKPSSTKWTAYTSNVVNCLVLPNCEIVFMPDTHGPNTGAAKNPFHARIEAILKENPPIPLTPKFIDAWELHRGRGNSAGGEVHCGSNVRRKPLQGVNWWEAWQ